MEITKLRLNGPEIDITYTTEAGEFRIKTIENADPALYKALAKIQSIFVKRLLMEFAKERLWVLGFDSGSDADGIFYRIFGQYEAHTIYHKMLTAKIRSYDKFVTTHREDSDVNEYPMYLNVEEEAAFIELIAESEAFVLGKRAQKELDFEGDNEGDSLFDLDNYDNENLEAIL